MKNNSIFINRLISSIFILIFLIYIFINNLNNSTKFIIIPFLFCSIFSIGKNICIIIMFMNHSNKINNIITMIILNILLDIIQMIC